MYAPSDFEQSLLMKASAELLNECVLSEFLYLFLLHIEIELMSTYMYINIHILIR